ncbi:unnamed protein product [Dracunculus medinensis]|uniref:NR LBD domain-containing protein n=1 Tax=Dracunculus medinensis TaxID=318479 RepID=A0A0N4UFA8_DRAME|nr:unnamed protein product [Dracunculus medinensis]
MADAIQTTYLSSIWQNLERYLTSHPKYHKVFCEAIDQLFYGCGPMILSDRHFIALMASSRHQCNSLMQLHKREFERLGGNINWLKGLQYVPLKIRNLDMLSAILAHQPWSIDVDHLSALTKCAPPANWSLSELLQAVIILAQTHVLCSFILGSYNDERPKFDKGTVANAQNNYDKQKIGEVESLLKRMNELKEIQLMVHNENISEQQRQKHFLEVHSEQISNDKISQGSSPSNVTISQHFYSLFTDNMNFCYVDFAKRARDGFAKTHKIHDISWEDHGYSCMDELYNEMADILDKKFRLTRSLTYFTMGGYSHVDTTKYRTAIWMYIQSLYGIRHDDYNYSEVNIMLSGEMKTFIKIISCFPEKTTASLRDSVMSEFKLSEKVHVILLIMEARFQAELIHFFRALIKLNSSSDNR